MNKLCLIQLKYGEITLISSHIIMKVLFQKNSAIYHYKIENNTQECKMALTSSIRISSYHSTEIAIKGGRLCLFTIGDRDIAAGIESAIDSIALPQENIQRYLQIFTDAFNSVEKNTNINIKI